MNASNQNPRFRDTTSLAGWLFADLFLGLIIVFLASSQVESKTHSTGTSTPTGALTKPLLLTHTATIPPTQAIGLNLEPLVISVHVENIDLFLQDNPSATESFLVQFNKKFPVEYQNRHSGLIIALGYHSARNISLARKLANHSIDILQSTYPKMFSGIIEKTYWWDADEFNIIGTIKFEIYFYMDNP